MWLLEFGAFVALPEKGRALPRPVVIADSRDESYPGAKAFVQDIPDSLASAPAAGLSDDCILGQSRSGPVRVSPDPESALHPSRDRGCGGKGHPQGFERFSDQSMGTTASRTAGVAQMPRTELVRTGAVTGGAMSLLPDIQKILGVTCDAASMLLSDGVERTLSRPERIGLRLHLWICRACRRFRCQLLFLQILMSELSRKAPPEVSAPPLSDDSRTRLHDAVLEASGREEG